MIKLNNPIRPDLLQLNKLLEKINDSGWYTNFGPIHNELTAQLEEYLGVKNLLLTNNGTSALQVAGRAIGSESILATPFSFVATASAFKWQKDKISFTDIDSKSLNISPTAIKDAYDNDCKADTILATHVYGNPCDVKAIDKLSKDNNLKVIYDAAHAFGVNVGKESILNFGDASSLSFHATKIFHTIDFKNPSVYKKAKELINFGINEENSIVNIGINAKLNEYQAAVGLINLQNIDNIIEHRSELFQQYRQLLIDIIELPSWHSEASFNGAYMPILLKNEQQLKAVSTKLTEANIQSRHYFKPSLDQVFTDSYNYNSTNSIYAAQKVLCLPLHAYMTIKDVNFVVENLKKNL